MSERTDPVDGPLDGTRDAPAPPSVAAWRLLGTLGVAGAVAGLLIVVVYGWAQPKIEEHQAMVLRAAVQEVLHDPARYERLFVWDGTITDTLPAGVDTMSVRRVYRGYDEAGAPIGFAIATEKAGFQDVVRLIFGFDPGTGRLLGMKVLESRETPGLGDRIEKDTLFVRGFAGVSAPLTGVKRGAGRGDPHEVDMITGATISSRTVIDAINAALDGLRPQLEAYAMGARQ